MAIDLTGAVDYAASNGQILISDLVLGSQSFDILPVQTGIKSSTKLIDFSEGFTYLQTGDPADTNYSGGTKMTDITITVTPLHIKEKYTKYDLEKKIAQTALKAGSKPEDLDFDKAIIGLKSQTLPANNEKLCWQGNTGSTGNLSYFNGFLTQVLASTDKIKTGTGATALTAASAITVVESIMNAGFAQFPEWIDVETAMFMSPANYTTWSRAIYKQNGQVDKNTIDGNPSKSMFIPGTNVKVYSISGLVGKNEILFTRKENFVLGVDLEGEEDTLQFEYFSVLNAYRLQALYKLGCKVARTKEVVVTAA